MKYYLIIFLIIIFPQVLPADDYLTINTPNKTVIETKPRNKITIVFSVKNNTDISRNVIPEVELPENFNLITEIAPFSLEREGTELVFINFFIPQKTPVGPYKISFFAADADNPDNKTSIVTDINVIPSYSLDINLLESPKYVFAGDNYTLLYRIENNGNLDTNVILNTNSSDGLAFKLEEVPLDAPFLINYSESKIIKLTVKTDEDINRIISHRFALTVSAVGDPDIKAEQINYVEIIPKVSMEVDPYHRFPIEFTLMESTRKYNNWMHVFGGRIYGNGTLDEEGYYNLRFLINKRLDTEDDTILSNPQDQFSISYWTEKVELWLGDHSFTLSPLIENNLFARGFRSRMIFPRVSFGAYYHQSLYSSKDNPTSSTFADFFIPDKDNPLGFKYRIGLNIFSNLDENYIMGIHQQFSPVKDFVLESDAAVGMKFNEVMNPAFFFKADGDHSWIHYAFKGIYSAPNFPGFYRDLYHVSSGLGFRLFDKRFRINGSFLIGQYNLSLDESLYHAALNRIIQSEIAYELKSSEADISFLWRNLYSEDKLPDSGFKRNENSLKLSVEQPWKILKLNISAIFGIVDDLLFDNRLYNQDYRTTLELNPLNSLSVSIGAGYNNTIDPDEDTEHTVSWNTDMDYEKNIINIYINFRNSYYFKEGSLSTMRLNYELGTVFTFDKDQELSIIYNHRITNSDDEWLNYFVFSIEYKKTFNAPMGRKEGISRISGRIFNNETNEPFPGVIVRIGNLSSVTDKNGYFSFPAVYPGNYYIAVDRATIPDDMIPVNEIPVLLEVKDNQDLYRDIPIVSGSKISGRMVLYDFDENTKELGTDGTTAETEQEIVEISGFPNIIVELTDGYSVLRRATDKYGNFIFDELRPGNWTLKIISKQIPEYHYFENEEFVFGLAPGAEEKITVRILPRKRTIKFLDTEPILIE